ncbi:NAD(P)/FAD-dependent oxidoreductase [Paenirhodobacter enshiensis]|uniref:D-amino acid oxidase n=1 Tax=Paenirhodobacter enshiensis TaxID=1105367 RepID=A0A086XWM6_9RHOB|nr:FAD-binding oxidoreductase [Paenirhodobacter enshiensis]KFI26426.1 D-amino acid oxidase [Paenirhodobacter enshiensis]
MPGPKLEPVISDTALPASVDVVVIGGGIAGTCAALELAERGLKVALCEKGEVGAEQSSRNWGWVRLSHRDPREMPLMVEAVRMWQGLDARLGADTGYKQCGITYTLASDAEMADAEVSVAEQNKYQIPAKMISASEALSRFPGLSLDIKGAMYNPADGRAEPQKAAPAVARAFQERGGTVHQNCAVRVIETAGGRVSGVVTEHGKIACSAVLLAGGAWSRMFLDNMGIYLPQLRTTSTVIRTTPIPEGPEGTIKYKTFTARRRADGGYTIAGADTGRCEITPDSFRLFGAFLPTLKNEWRGLKMTVGRQTLEGLSRRRRWGPADRTPFEDTRILDPVPDRKAADRMLAALKAAYPVFGAASVAHCWAGEIDVLPDVIPAISATEGVKNGVPGLYIATGFSGHGFGLGPAAGRLAADLVSGHAPIVDPTPFRLSRFTDGSKIAPMIGITTR